MNKTVKFTFSKNFILVAAGQIISLFGNQILRYALPLYLLNLTGSAAIFGTIQAAAFLPMLLLYPVGGIIADRFNKRNIMVILDFFTGILILLFCVLKGVTDIVPLAAVVMMILYGIQGAYQPAVKASVPVLVEAEHLMQANSVIDVISSLSSMAGPVMGGILFSISGLSPILYVSAVCFFASAVMEIFIHIPYDKKQREGSIFAAGFQDLKGSFRTMFHEETVLWKMSFVFASVNLFLTSLILVGLPIIITQHLSFPLDMANRLYGYAEGTLAAGNVLGGILAGVLSRKWKPSSVSPLIAGCALSVFTGGIALQLLKAPMFAYLALVTCCGLLMVLEALITVQIMSYLQLLTPSEQIGKVTACVLCICMCANPAGQFFYGMIFEKIGNDIYVPFYIAACVMFGIGFMNRHTFDKVGV